MRQWLASLSTEELFAGGALAVSAVALLISIAGGLVNFFIARRALRVAKFERDVAAPLLRAVDQIGHVADSLMALARSRIPLSERKEAANKLHADATFAHAGLTRHLRYAIETPRSRFSDWGDILFDGDLDAEALDRFAEALETETESEFDEHLRAASDAFEEISVRARRRIERES
jgi:hypothetical protein